jgi:hypothetical protein
MEPDMQLSRDYFVAYDYGMGGAWAIAVAQSENQIREYFPEFEVHRNRPTWMTDEIYDNLRENSYFTVGDEATYPDWILSIARNRMEKR